MEVLFDTTTRQKTIYDVCKQHIFKIFF